MDAAWIIIFMINSTFFVDHKTVEEILETIDDTVLGMSLINTVYYQEISEVSKFHG